MNEILVQIDSITKIFSKDLPPALENISAIIPKGQMVGLAGPDGAGKTTLMRLIAGLLLPTSGTIQVNGYDTVKDATVIPFLIGYMPQKFGLYEDLTVAQNLNLYADLRNLPQKERQEVFKKLLSFTGLTPFTGRLAGALSGGMKQKLGIACALVRKPSLLLLDEPSVGVDPVSRRELWEMVQELLSDGISVIWSTAYLDEAERCSNVLLLNEGKLLFEGDPKQLTQRVEGRTFKIGNIQGGRRTLLIETLNQSNILDGIIQGQELRITTRTKEEHPIIKKMEPPLSLEATPPRFEDAFMDILGGGPGGTSKLADQMPQLISNQEIIVEANNLSKKYGSFTAVDAVSFQIKQGEIFGLLGPNGAGKSTIFKMMCGLIKPTQGKATVNGYDLQQAPGVARSQLGYMAQKFSLYGNLSVQQNLNFFSGIYNLSGKRQKEAIDQMIDIFNFQDFLNTNAEMLPLGFKQRLALSCAVMHRPRVLFLDEPTSGVDPITRREFWNHINGLVEKGITVMVTTHFMDEAEYCDRIGLVYQSKLIRLGTPEELKKEAATKEHPEPTLEEAFIELIKN